MDPMVTNGSIGEGEMTSYQELWAKTSKAYGGFIPPSTFRRWVVDFCLLEAQSVYEPDEVGWVLELAQIARRFPKGSPKIKEVLHKKMKECHEAI
jgi:hypothetical protein